MIGYLRLISERGSRTEAGVLKVDNVKRIPSSIILLSSTFEKELTLLFLYTRMSSTPETNNVSLSGLIHNRHHINEQTLISIPITVSRNLFHTNRYGLASPYMINNDT